MSAILATILQALLRAVLDWGKAWVDAEHAKADEWAASTLRGQLAAAERAKTVTLRINDLTVQPKWSPQDVAEWNRGQLAPDQTVWSQFGPSSNWNGKAMLPLLLILPLLTACSLFTREVYVDGDWPLISVPTHPLLPTDPPELSPRERILAGYALTLEARLAAYNREAAAHNASQRSQVRP